MAQHIFLSAHLDDVILSCAGILHHLVEQGHTIQVVTIFAGLPDLSQPITEFAHTLHERWGEMEQVFQMRRAEDKQAFAYFGIDPIWLDFQDCIYRGSSDKHYYPTHKSIFGDIHPNEHSFPSTILTTVSKKINIDTKTTLYAPIGIGNHVDHQLTRLVAAHFLGKCKQLYFYQDYPYVHKCNDKEIESYLATLKNLIATNQNWQSCLINISQKALALKIKAISAYQSQISSLFESDTAMATNVTDFSRRTGSGEFAEKYWFLTQT